MSSILGIIPWILVFIFQKLSLHKISKHLFLIFLLYSTAVLAFFYGYKITAFSVLIMFLSFMHTYFINTKVLKLLSFIWFGLILMLYIYGTLKNMKSMDFLIPISIATLSVRIYQSKAEFIFWNFLNILNILVFFLDKNNLILVLSDYAFYFLFLSIEEYKRNLEKENIEYKKLLDRAVNTEVQKKLLQIDDSIAISSKKLKEIFKLSNYTVSTTDIEAMSERVVNGLLDLGYTGVIIYIKPRNIFKKGGFFPNYKIIHENFNIKNISKVQINEDDKYILIPLKVSNEILGYLAVYKKEGVSAKEVDYLVTYANSVATAVANIIHFEDLLKLEELTYKTFESLDIGIAVLDKDLNVKTANKMFKLMTKKDSKILTESIPELENLEKDLKKVINDKQPFETVLSSVNKKGSVYRIKALPLESVSLDTSESDEFVLIIEDITEKEKLEAQVIETEKLAAIGKMAAALAHEIKNPLQAIAASAYSIKSKAKKYDDKKILEFSEKIETHSKRARSIIDKLLNYSKPSYREIETINLKELLNQALEFVEHSLKGKKIKVKTDLRKDVFIEGDKNALQQVFINIIINAIEELESIENHEGIIEISLDREDKFATVYIKDNGRGISDDIIEDIFEPFFTTKEKGTGLGLSVVSRIVKDHGGEVIVKKENGTVFIIKLPLTEQ